MTDLDEILMDDGITEKEQIVEESPVPIVPSGKIEPDEEAVKLAARLEGWNKSCRDLFLDLRMITFKVTDEDMFIEFKDKNFYEKPIYFKMDPDDNKSDKVTLARKQFSKLIGIPYNFFMNNRPALKMDVFNTWQASLGAEESKGRCLSRIRESNDCCIIRALVPDTYSPIQNHEIIKLVNETITVPFKLEMVTGDERDDLIMHARFIFGDTFEILGQKVCLGFAVTASEFGASPLIVDSFLYHSESKTAYFATYGKEPYFKSKYEGIQPKQFKELLPTMITRMQEEAGEYKTRIEDLSGKVTPLDECIKLRNWKGLPGKFKKGIFQEAYKNEADMSNTFFFARHMALLAKDFDIKKRIEIERATGRYLNLVFSKQ
jgi:hypothetical protein